MGACLLIHGFTGSPFELEPLAARLREEGHDVLLPTLAGHGGGRGEMERVTWLDWIHSADAALNELLRRNERVHLVGFSMGGLIAAYLSVKYAGRVTSLTMLSAPIYTLNPKQLFKKIAEAIQLTMRHRSPHEDITRYLTKMKATPPRSLAHFRRLVQTVKPMISEVEVPLLVIQGQLDELVEARSADYIHQTARSERKDIHYFPESAHMICHDCEAHHVVDLVIDFVHELDGRWEHVDTRHEQHHDPT